MVGLQLRYFGGAHVSLNGEEVTGFRAGKARALLCYLAVSGRPHTRTALAELLWTDMSDTSSGMNLRKTVMNLHQLIGSYLTITRYEIAFNQTLPYQLDVHTFEAGVAMLSAPSDLQPADLIRATEAINLCQAAFLEGFYVRDAPLFEAWAMDQRWQLHHMLVNALRTLASFHALKRAYQESISFFRRLLIAEPLDEPAHRELMTLFAYTGRRSAALRQYEVCKALLKEELGVAPEPMTTALYEMLRDGKFPDSPH